MKMLEFGGFPKIKRFSSPIRITEKIDGTNGQIWFAAQYDIGEELYEEIINSPFFEELDTPEEVVMLVGSRNRYLKEENDNHGFFRWCVERKDQLFSTLGYGKWFGEFWGHKIQRGYGCKPEERYFSCFDLDVFPEKGKDVGLRCVPLLYEGDWFCSNPNYNVDGEFSVHEIMNTLNEHGSYAKPGYDNPEGIVIQHLASGVLLKKTFDEDNLMRGKPKQLRNALHLFDKYGMEALDNYEFVRKVWPMLHTEGFITLINDLEWIITKKGEECLDS